MNNKSKEDADGTATVDFNNDTSSHQQRKRTNKRRRLHNPLADARQNHNDNDKLESLWHRKSGAGFWLFAEYYASQPAGVVCSDDAVVVSGSSSSTAHGTNPNDNDPAYQIHQPRAGQGQSRASKRRKKKKGKSNAGDGASVSMDEPRVGVDSPVANAAAAAADPSEKTSPAILLSSSFTNNIHNNAIDERFANVLHHYHNSPVATFLRTLASPLPLTFRVRRTVPAETQQQLLQQIGQSEFAHLVSPMTCLDPSIYQAKRSSHSNNNNSPTPALSKSTLSTISPALKEFLVTGSGNGTLARQELASMLPVLALSRGGWLALSASSAINKSSDDKKINTTTASTSTTMRVLDLCASPGSKTLQVLEELLVMLGKTTTATSSSSAGTQRRLRRCVVQANDVNESRLKALRDAVERSGLQLTTTTPASSSSLSCRNNSHNHNHSRTTTRVLEIQYSNLDARHYPIPTNERQRFDIVICDVPCSGDGTIRKDAHILPHWTPTTSHALHTLQCKILLRALQCLKVGGVCSYSTCSLNPVEDEAVVAAALTTYMLQATTTHRHNPSRETKKKGQKDDYETTINDNEDQSRPAVELLPWPEQLTADGFQVRPGVSHWKIADYVGNTKRNDNHMGIDDEDGGGGDDGNDDDQARLQWHASFPDAVQANMKHAVATMWPPSLSSSSGLHLERCVRIWPQDNDSGGFFVALIRKNW